VVPISILLVDDDSEYADLLGRVLRQAGLDVALCGNGRLALQEISRNNFDLVLMDVTMPEIDGFSALHQLRRISETPVIMLTSRIAAADRVHGLDTGADDYICKPCDPDELLSRVRAVLRRTSPSSTQNPTFSFGSHRFNVKTQELLSNGVPVKLTSLEGELLSMLLQARGRVVMRESIAMALQDRELNAFDRSLDVHISRLRTKLGDDAPTIQTVRGIGYAMQTAREGM
jgi:DNA-binding response OmpR family regulator